MKNVSILIPAILGLALAGCSKKPDPASEPQPSAEEVREALKGLKGLYEEAKSKCPDYTLSAHGKNREFCEVTYTSLKDIAIDGDKAVWKRAKFTCRFERINNGKVYCGAGVHQAQVDFGDTLKPLVKKLRRGKLLTIDLAIGVMGPLGPKGWAFDIKLGR